MTLKVEVVIFSTGNIFGEFCVTKCRGPSSRKKPSLTSSTHCHVLTIFGGFYIGFVAHLLCALFDLTLMSDEVKAQTFSAFGGASSGVPSPARGGWPPWRCAQSIVRRYIGAADLSLQYRHIGYPDFRYIILYRVFLLIRSPIKWDDESWNENVDTWEFCLEQENIQNTLTSKVP